MSQASPYLRKTDGGYAHWCPGCEEMHVIAVERPQPNGAQWSFDGNVNRPTFAPSINIVARDLPYGDGSVYVTKRDELMRTTEVCHYFIRSGEIQFCADSTHPLKGQVVPLPELPVRISD